MKAYTQKSRGLELTLSVPTSIEEFDTVVGTPGAALSFANDEAIYRSVLPKIWNKAAELIPDKFSFPRKTWTEKGKDDDGNEVDVECEEDNTKFLQRWKASFEDGTRQPFIQAIADEVGFDVSKSERSTKPEKTFITRAESLAAKVAAGQSTWERVLENIQARCPSASFSIEDGEVDINEVAAALQAMFKSDDLA